jgi:hypothetical protein
MAAKNDTLEADIDGLYALSLDEFTVARDELARTLRTEGEREAAREVKRLRRPSLAAWALNQVRRDDPRGVEQLIAAGERLRDATERLLTAGEREPLERATAEERRLVKALARHAERQLVGAGHPASGAVQSKLLATLRAAASDAEARESLSVGRLVRDYEVSDFGLGAALASMPTKPRAEPAQPAQPDAAVRAGVARKARGMRQRLERAQARQRELEDKADAAKRRAKDARQEAARASASLERAEAGAEQARVSAREAAEQVALLEASLRELESRAR